MKGKALISRSKKPSTSNIRKNIQSYEKSIDGIKDQQNPLDQFIFSLEENYITSDDAKNYYRWIKMIKALRLLLGLIFIVFGFAVIIIPLPNHLEIATLLYFNPNDGITISDLIALFILGLGGYLIIKEVKRRDQISC